MQIIKAIATLILLLGVSCVAASTPTLGECKKLCKDTRQSILRDTNPCQAAAKHSSSQKDFPLCVEGRKKAFDQACVPICTQAELTVTSFEGCQIIARGKGVQGVSWCRKGYDSILQSVGPFLNEHSKKLKQIESESNQSVEESVPVKGEPVVEAMNNVVDPIVIESNHEPAAKEAVVVDSTNEELELEESAEAAHTVINSKDPLEQHESEAKEAPVVDSLSEDEIAAAVDAEQTQVIFDSDEIESDIHQAANDIQIDVGEPGTGKETEL